MPKSSKKIKESDPMRGSKAAPKGLSEAIDQSLGLQMISIRLPAAVIEQLKIKASSQGIGYQPYIRQLLTNHVNGNAEGSQLWGAAESSSGSDLDARFASIEEQLRELRADRASAKKARR